MTEVNTRKFYQFLAQYQSEGGWVNVADSQHGNGDGTVIKSEFSKFMKAEWNGEENGELTNDLINSFWKKIDTNTSASKISGTKLKNLNALDKTEVANLDKQLEVYVKFDEFISNNVKIPNVLTSTGSQWKTDVKDQLGKLLDNYINGGASGDLDALLAEAYPQIANKCTAQYCAVEYQNSLMNTVLKDYPDYRVADDATLQSLITAYISTIDADTDAKAIKEAIRSIMDAYLATAGLGNGSDYDLSSLGFDGEELNGLQIAVITQTIKNQLSSEIGNYEGYEDEFNTAVQQFIDSKIAAGGTFEELKACAGEFATSEFKTNLDNVITIDKTYKNVEEGSTFYKALVKEFGESFAKLISQDARYLDVYKEILNDVKTQVQNGSLKMEDVSNYILKQIADKIVDFFPNGYGDMSLSELSSMYDMMASAADAQNDDDKSLTQHREAAINYCDAVAAKSTSLKTAVTDIFGSNWSSTINSLYPSEIKSKMAELKAKVAEIGDISEMSDAEKSSLLNNIPETLTLSYGASKDFDLPSSASCKGSVITTDRITYVASGVLSYNKTNNTVAVDSSKAGTYTGTIVMYIDGVKVASKTITVTITKELDVATIADDVKWSGDAPSGITVMTKANGNNVGNALDSQDFANLYNSDAIICLGFFKDNNKYNWSRDGASIVKGRLTELGTFVINSIASAMSNVDKTLLTKAMNTVVNKYAVEPTGDYYLRKKKGDTPANFYNYMKDNKNKVKNGLVQTKDPDGKDSNVYGLYFKEFVDAIIAEYNKLVA